MGKPLLREPVRLAGERLSALLRCLEVEQARVEALDGDAVLEVGTDSENEVDATSTEDETATDTNSEAGLSLRLNADGIAITSASEVNTEADLEVFAHGTTELELLPVDGDPYEAVDHQRATHRSGAQRLGAGTQGPPGRPTLRRARTRRAGSPRSARRSRRS